MSDPTNTEQIRERFIREVRRRFKRLRGRIREVVGYDENRLHLTEDSRLSSYDLEIDVPGPKVNLEWPDLLMAHHLWGVDEVAVLADADDVERFPTDGGKTRAFIKWLREKLDADILEPATRKEVRNGEHWTAPYIRAAAGRAWANATSRLQEEGVSVSEEALEDVFRAGVPRRQLRKLYTRVYENVESVTTEAAPQVRDILTQSLAEGVNPREAARRLTKEVRTIQHTRAEVLARTETIFSYSEMSVTRYEQAGVETVQHGEWIATDDDRTCPICERLDGREIPIGDVREATFTFEPDDDQPDHLAGEYRMMPPAHPSGRCALLPVIS